jgi:hypothetical protein
MVLKKIHLGDAVFSCDSSGAAGAAPTSGIVDVRRLVATESENLSHRLPPSSSPSSLLQLSSINRERPSSTAGGVTGGGSGRSSIAAGRNTIAARVHSLIMALAVCHSVTPSKGSDGVLE